MRGKAQDLGDTQEFLARHHNLMVASDPQHRDWC